MPTVKFTSYSWITLDSVEGIELLSPISFSGGYLKGILNGITYHVIVIEKSTNSIKVTSSTSVPWFKDIPLSRGDAIYAYPNKDSTYYGKGRALIDTLFSGNGSYDLGIPSAQDTVYPKETVTASFGPSPGQYINYTPVVPKNTNTTTSTTSIVIGSTATAVLSTVTSNLISASTASITPYGNSITITPGPEPSIITTGTIAICNGSTWNPGNDGKQHLMIYINGFWTQLDSNSNNTSSATATIATATTVGKSLGTLLGVGSLGTLITG